MADCSQSGTPRQRGSSVRGTETLVLKEDLRIALMSFHERRGCYGPRLSVLGIR